MRVRGSYVEDYTAGKPWKMEKRRRIMDAAFGLFSDRGIIPVTISDVAQVSGVSRATVFRYFATKLDLVMAVAASGWEDYLHAAETSLPAETLDGMSGAQCLSAFLEVSLDLYRNHSDFLRFNYDFNSYLRLESATEEQRLPFRRISDVLGAQFHFLYDLGMRDGTLRRDVSETMMLSSSIHIMLAAATRYATGLVVAYEGVADPECELEMLKEMMLARFTNRQVVHADT